jgi:hypothetical protein
MSYEVTERSTPRRIRFTCSICGSEDVETKSWCGWDKDEQNWVYVEDLDSGEDFFCNGCKDTPEDLNIQTLADE